MNTHKNLYFLTLFCIIILLGMIIVKGYINNMKIDHNDYFQSIKKILITDKIDDSILFPENKSQKVKIPVLKPIIDPNIISAESYLIGNLENGKIYLDYNYDKVFPIASLSKLFTAIVSIHDMDQTKKVIITQESLDTFGDAGNLIKDEKFTPSELLYPLLLESSNDAADALARSFDYDKFIKKMNDYTIELGMNSTSFKDASGLSSSNTSNSKDLFILSKYLYNNEKDLLDITKQKEVEFATTTDHKYHHFFSINPFIFYKPFIGGKTGRTFEAQESMITLLNYKVGTTTYPISIIVLRSKYSERETDTEKILELFEKKINN